MMKSTLYFKRPPHCISAGWQTSFILHLSSSILKEVSGIRPPSFLLHPPAVMFHNKWGA